MFFPFRHIPPLGPPKANARQRVLAQWRGVDFAPHEIAKSFRARSSNDVMPAVLKELRIDKRRTDAEVVKVWNNLLDPMIVIISTPI